VNILLENVAYGVLEAILGIIRSRREKHNTIYKHPKWILIGIAEGRLGGILLSFIPEPYISYTGAFIAGYLGKDFIFLTAPTLLRKILNYFS
jgi:hypothetical protein